ncbi:hypothetical protein ACFVIM_01610, partial [Streptomyces sp. NPDC057638]|uniref:hypothetical protein n=1 Tax=Streptomyces sp. NPDC057638 TaxID=3346190 RepID=UPI0036940F6B
MRAVVSGVVALAAVSAVMSPLGSGLVSQAGGPFAAAPSPDPVRTEGGGSEGAIAAAAAKPQQQASPMPTGPVSSTDVA